MSDHTNTARTDPAYVAVPHGGAGPGVVVLHAWWGLNSFFKQLCDRLAAEGFVVAAPDLFNGTIATTVEEAEQLATNAEADMAAIEARVRDAIVFLRAHPAVRGDSLGVLGVSFGGAWSLLAATFAPDDIGAVVLFYDAWARDWSASRAAYLGHFASDDPFTSQEDVQSLETSLRAVGRPVQFYTYPGTAHWFFEDDRPEYNAEAAQLAWERTLLFLRERLAG